MDFVRILRSLEELLYEVMTWIVLYPRTMWRIATSPLAMLRYSDRELTEPPGKQYTDALSPPLLLMLTLALTHLAQDALIGSDPAVAGMMARLMSSEQNLLITRSVAFSIFPLMYATQQLRRSGQALDRETLRTPFFGQCYLAAVFSLFVGAAAVLIEQPRWRQAGLAVGLATCLWYLVIQVRWLRERNLARPWPAVGLACGAFLGALAIVVAAGVILSTMR